MCDYVQSDPRGVLTFLGDRRTYRRAGELRTMAVPWIISRTGRLGAYLLLCGSTGLPSRRRWSMRTEI